MGSSEPAAELLWSVGLRDQLGLEDVICLTIPKTQPPQQTKHFSVANYISNVSSPVWYSWYFYMQNSYKCEGDLAFSCSLLYCSDKQRVVWKDLRYCCVREESWGSESCSRAPFPAWWAEDKTECVGRSSSVVSQAFYRQFLARKKKLLHILAILKCRLGRIFLSWLSYVKFMGLIQQNLEILWPGGFVAIFILFSNKGGQTKGAKWCFLGLEYMKDSFTLIHVLLCSYKA